MYAYIDPACGRPAFLLADKPEPGKHFLSAKAYSLDNSPIPSGGPCVCESCGDTMFGTAASVENVVNYIAWKSENKELVLSE